MDSPHIRKPAPFFSPPNWCLEFQTLSRHFHADGSCYVWTGACVRNHSVLLQGDPGRGGSLTGREAATHPEFRCQPRGRKSWFLNQLITRVNTRNRAHFFTSSPGPASSAVSVPAPRWLLWMPSSGSLTTDSDTGGERLALLPPPLPPPHKGCPSIRAGGTTA